VVFVCPGCKARFRVKKAPQSGKIKCPRCGLISALRPGAPASAAGTPPPPAPPELEVNTDVAGHKILEYLGGSPFTAVYKASQTSMGRTVLFNVLRRQYAADPSTKSRFFAGARAAARLNHPNLLSVFDMGEEGDVAFYTTEFVDGGTLPEFLGRKDKISSEQRLAIATQIAQALAYAVALNVEQVWLIPEDVLLTDKGDVRVAHVGTGAPLRGGSPEPIMDALTRLVYRVATSSPLPPSAGADGGPPPMPTARDALGSKFNALVRRLVTEGAEAYPTVGAFATELETLSEGVQRRGTVHATSAPGGVVPLRLERAHRRELPVRKILTITVIAAGLCAVILFFVLQSIRTERRGSEARVLWDEACELAESTDTLVKALKRFEELAEDYPDTPDGQRAKTEAIGRIKESIVNSKYAEAVLKLRGQPGEMGAARAAIEAAREELEELFPDLGFVQEKEKEVMKNLQEHYDAAAVKDWNNNGLKDVQRAIDRMQFTKAIETAQGYAKKWPRSDAVQAVVDRNILKINPLAKKKFDEIMAEVDRLVARGRRGEAEEELGRIIRSFGTEFQEYVDKARAKQGEIGPN